MPYFKYKNYDGSNIYYNFIVRSCIILSMITVYYEWFGILEFVIYTYLTRRNE